VPAAEWLSPSLRNCCLKRIEFDGCRVNFEPSPEVWPPFSGPSFHCQGCRRSLPVPSLYYHENQMKLCLPCWAMGLMDAWEGSTDRYASHEHPCTAARPWQPHPHRPHFVTHPEARTVHCYKDFYDSTMHVKVCPHCQHAWLEGWMK